MTATTAAAGSDLDLEAGSVVLAELVSAVRASESALARAVVAAGRLAGSRVVERVEGVTVDYHLTLACRLTGSDTGTLLTAGETLRTLPRTTALFLEGLLSWGQIRRIVRSALKVTVADRATLDGRIAATHARWTVGSFSPDDLCDVIDAAAEELRNPRLRERAEQRRVRGEFLSLQSDFEGGVRIFGQLGAMSAAILLEALTVEVNKQAKTTGDGDGREDTDPTPGDHADPVADLGEPGVWTGRDRSREQAQALIALAAAAAAGVFADGTPRPARPLFHVIVNAADATRTAAGTVVLDVPGILPTITARLVEQLSQDATLQAVLFDGHRPLAVARKLYADRIPADVRTAVAVRDVGSRFAGSRQPAGRSHVHHLVHREHGGTNAVDNLALLSSSEHLRLVHRHGWQGRIGPATGITLWTRRGVTYRSVPRGTPLDPAPPGDPPGDPPTDAPAQLDLRTEHDPPVEQHHDPSPDRPLDLGMPF